MSVSPLCLLPGGLALRCTCEGLFLCFSADCLAGENGVKKIKFVDNDNTISCSESSRMPFAQDVETSVPNNDSPCQDYPQLEDHTKIRCDMTSDHSQNINQITSKKYKL